MGVACGVVGAGLVWYVTYSAKKLYKGFKKVWYNR